MLNAYGLVVLFALVGDYVVHVVVERLNLRAMAPRLPAGFADVYDEETYRKSQQYARARARFAFWPRTFGLLLLLSFWRVGGFEYLDSALRSLELGSIPTGLMFFAALILGQGVLMLPFRIYSTFVIEERFGFNRTTPSTFVSDTLKGLALGAVLGGGLAAILLTVFERAGQSAWLLCWGVTGAAILLIQFIAPTWIMPLFIKFTPMQEGPLRSRIFEYARSVNFPLDNLFVVDGSRRSTKANAFFTGFGANRRIGLFDTLIERHSADELVAVLAHEVGHYKKHHITQGMIISILHLGVLFFATGIFMRQPDLYSAFGVTEMSVHAGLVFCLLLYSPVEIVLGIVLNARSRRHEYEADRFAVETTGMGPALVSGLQKLASDNLANLTPHPAQVLLHHTHPPLAERLAAIESHSAAQ